jgi:hypothetical protein
MQKKKTFSAPTTTMFSKKDEIGTDAGAARCLNLATVSDVLSSEAGLDGTDREIRHEAPYLPTEEMRCKPSRLPCLRTEKERK